MIIMGDLQIKGFLKEGAFEPSESFPANPTAGTWALIQRRFMMCVALEGGVPLWIPLTQELNSHVHTQEIVSDRWIVPHNLNFSTPIVQCYDGSGKVVNPTEINPIDQDTMEIVFPDPILGRAILMFGINEGLAKPNVAFDQDFTDATEVIVPHGLGYKPVITVVSQGYEVQPNSIEHDESFMSVTLTFNSPITGTVRCV